VESWEGARKLALSLSRIKKEKSRIMSIIKLEPTKKNPDLVIEYLGKKYTLPGQISVAMLERLVAIKDKDSESGEAFVAAFLELVVPTDFKQVLSQDDLAQLIPIWMEHIQGPKGSSSKS
jgi:hypothetical protein